MSKFDYPIVVIGAGAGGLVVAIGAAKAGKKVLLIEKGTWGGDCTNFGCVPSKSLIASAHTAHAIREAESLGVVPKSTEFEATKALERVREIVAQIRKHEEPVQLEEHGVEVLQGVAQFVDSHTLQVDGRTITAGQIVIATGSYPVMPKIPGIESVPFLTNETVFDLEEIPESLIVMGGGPIGCELGQAFSRLGSKVSIIQSRDHLLVREEPEAQVIVEEQLRKEGIELFLCGHATKVEQANGKIQAHIACGAAVGTHLLIAAGRRPNIEKLNLDAAGVRYTPKGIPTDNYGRSNVKHIWAIGDATTGAPFTHMTENAGRAVLTSILIPGFAKKPLETLVPRVTYTDPEVASCGLLEAEAIEQYGAKKIATYTLPLDKVDRAITTSRTEGVIKIVTRKWSSKILGVTIVAPRAGEMLGEVTLAMRNNISLRKIANLIHPYPTYSLGIRTTADQWLTKTLLRR